MNQKKHKPRAALHLIWAFPLFILLAIVCIMYVVPAFEKTDLTPVADSAHWMAKLDDSLSLGETVLPGTHDCATKNVQLAFFSKCQSLEIGEQLEAGFRYLDIRLGVDGERLKLMHGFTNCTVTGWPWAKALYLDAVLTQCYDFLRAHPTETVVFAVKQEHGGETTAAFETILDAYIQKNPDQWLLTDHIPTIGEARGKLILMRRYADEAGLGIRSGIPLLWDDQGGHEDTSKNIATHDNGTYTLNVQDRYEYELDQKWPAFLAGLKAAGTGKDVVSIHFMSTKGSAKYGHPYAFAKMMNAFVMKMDTNALSGWIIADFASATLAQHIYQANFR